MKKLVILAMALVPLSLGSSAFAQSVTDVKGNLLVNRGAGFVPMQAGSPVALGDRLMVRPGNKAVLRYDGGCRVNVVPGQVVTVTEAPVCSAFEDVKPKVLTQNLGGNSQNPVLEPFDSAFGGFNPGYVLIGGAVIAGGLLITLNSPSDKSKGLNTNSNNPNGLNSNSDDPNGLNTNSDNPISP